MQFGVDAISSIIDNVTPKPRDRFLPQSDKQKSDNDAHSFYQRGLQFCSLEGPFSRRKKQSCHFNSFVRVSLELSQVMYAFRVYRIVYGTTGSASVTMTEFENQDGRHTSHATHANCET